jgi:hypothetical protein
MAKFYKTQNNVESKHPVSLAPMIWERGDVLSSEDLPAHDIDRLVKHGDLESITQKWAEDVATELQRIFDELQLRKSKGLHVDPHYSEGIERGLQKWSRVAKAVAG